MPRILTLVLIAIVALTALSFTFHFLFSPWLLVAIAILAVDQVPPAPLPPVVPDGHLVVAPGRGGDSGPFR